MQSMWWMNRQDASHRAVPMAILGPTQSGRYQRTAPLEGVRHALPYANTTVGSQRFRCLEVLNDKQKDSAFIHAAASGLRGPDLQKHQAAAPSRAPFHRSLATGNLSSCPVSCRHGDRRPFRTAQVATIWGPRQVRFRIARGHRPPRFVLSRRASKAANTLRGPEGAADPEAV